MDTTMTMTYEYISPERAMQMLEKNEINRKISKGSVQCYANDISHKHWVEQSSHAIAFDDDGILRDGQHRLMAIVAANKGLHTWVCRGVAPDAIFDFNRPRTTSDQIAITRPDLPTVYKSTRVISVLGALIRHEAPLPYRSLRGKYSSQEVTEYIDEHRAELDDFFLTMPQSSICKISLAVVFLGLYLAYLGGVKMERITAFYTILCDGMSLSPEDFPIIAYRNYLLTTRGVNTTDEEVKRCQYALKKYLTGSCTKRNIVPKDFIWDFPKSNES